MDTCRQYCRIRNDLQRDIERKKSVFFFESQINENIGKPRKFWQSLKNLGYSYKSESYAKIVLRIADKLCHDNLQIFNYVNNFVTTVAANLVKRMKSVGNVYGVYSNKFKEFYANKGIIPGNFKLKPVSIECVLKELLRLNTY